MPPLVLTEMRCYQPRLGSDEGACTHPARYVARVTWTFGELHLCEDHAQQERAHGDVISIRTLERSRD